MKKFYVKEGNSWSNNHPILVFDEVWFTNGSLVRIIAVSGNTRKEIEGVINSVKKDSLELVNDTQLFCINFYEILEIWDK